MTRIIVRVAASVYLCSAMLWAAQEGSVGWQQLVMRGDEQHRTQHWYAAATSYLDALGLASRDANWRQQALCLNRLGLVYKGLGRYATAEQYTRRALHLWERHEPQNAHETLVAKTNLGIVLHAERKFHEAEKFLTDVLAECRHTLGLSHSDTTAAMNNLAAVYHEQGRLDEAEKLYRQVYELHGAASQTGDIALLTWNNLALTYAAQGRWKEANSLYREILARLRSLEVKRPSLEATVLNNLGLLCARVGKKEEALSYLAECVKLRDAHLGPEHPDSMDAALNYAAILKQAKRSKEARFYSSRSSLAHPATVDITSLMGRR